MPDVHAIFFTPHIWWLFWHITFTINLIQCELSIIDDQHNFCQAATHLFPPVSKPILLAWIGGFGWCFTCFLLFVLAYISREHPEKRNCFKGNYVLSAKGAVNSQGSGSEMHGEEGQGQISNFSFTITNVLLLKILWNWFSLGLSETFEFFTIFGTQHFWNELNK